MHGMRQAMPPEGAEAIRRREGYGLFCQDTGFEMNIGRGYAGMKRILFFLWFYAV